MLLYEDEKGPIVAKTYGGTSWSSTQSRVSKAQKTKGILNVFGIYDYTNNRMWTHNYRKKTGKQFLDFIKRVDQKYDDHIKQIFLVLDNISIHKSNKVKQTIAKHHPRIQLVFLPTRCPELNLIEARWMWMHRQAINNSTFLNEQDIGKAVSEWTHDYNQKHTAKTSIISLHEESIYMFT
ncbi:MAG: IS630 family transposase [Candidatus Nitrosocosmicus sp.]